MLIFSSIFSAVRVAQGCHITSTFAKVYAFLTFF